MFVVAEQCLSKTQQEVLEIYWRQFIKEKTIFKLCKKNLDVLNCECECLFVELINEFYLDINPSVDEQNS